MVLTSNDSSPAYNDTVAPHRILTVEDVLHDIFYYLSPPINSYLNSGITYDEEDNLKVPVAKSTLLSAALSCRALREPALDALWRTLDSLHPLCSLIPLTGEGTEMTAGDLISSDTPSLLNRYQSRVRTLIWTMRKDACSSQYFMATALGSSFLPNLQTLIIPQLDALETNLLFAIRSTTIQTIDANPGLLPAEVTADFKSLVSTLCYRSRNSIQHISFPSFDLPITVLSLRSLRSIRLPYAAEIPLSTIQNLSTHPNLRSVNFKLDATLESISELPFSSIEKARLSGKVSAIQHFLERCDSTTLTSLSLFFHRTTEGTPPTLSPLIWIMKEKWRTTLSSLVIDHKVSTIPPEDVATYIQELGNLPLVSLHLYLGKDYHFSGSQTLTTIASHFPHIRNLHLPPFPADNAPTIFELSQVAKSHPSLRRLTTSLNTQPTITDSPILQHGLNTLLVHDSTVSDVFYTAERLYRSFPYLERIIPRSGSPDGEKWKEVEKLLQFARRTRYQS